MIPSRRKFASLSVPFVSDSKKLKLDNETEDPTASEDDGENEGIVELKDMFQAKGDVDSESDGESEDDELDDVHEAGIDIRYHLISPDAAIIKMEQFDVQMAQRILAQKDKHSKFDINVIVKMLKNREKGNSFKVTYTLGGNGKGEFVGRYYPNPYVGLSTLSRNVRSALAASLYWDIDFVNCQFVILRAMARCRNWQAECVELYCANRDKIFATLMQENSQLDRDDCKKLFLRVLFGGKVHQNDPVWVRDKFAPEMQQLQENIRDAYPKLYEKIQSQCDKKKLNNSLGSCCAMILQTEERKCLIALERFLYKNDRSMDVLIHDGGYVAKLVDGSGKSESSFPEVLLRKAEKDILAKTGYDLKLVVKPIRNTYELDVIDIHGAHVHANDYESVKRYFENEKGVFLCADQSLYYIFGRDGQVNVKTKRELVVVYENLRYSGFDRDSQTFRTDLPFLKKWFIDPMKATKEYVELVIPPRIAKPDTKNLWRGLAVTHIESPVVDDDLQAKLNKILLHIRRIHDENEKACEYFLDWVAHLFKYPGTKANVCPVIKTIQGAGKNILYEFLELIIGKEYCVVGDVKNDVFCQFNSLMKNKLLVLLDDPSPALCKKYDEDLKRLITQKKCFQ
jgi:hypothetical protein